MEAKTKRKIKDLGRYRKLFPKAPGLRHEISEDADVWDTVKLIKKVVAKTLSHTAKIAEDRKGNTLEETCNNLWDFVFTHVQYVKDTPGIEEIRSPRRLLSDQKGDCDCMTTFLSSCLTNLRIAHSLRLAAYSAGVLQHIYIIVPKPQGGYITMDCVVDSFNYEEPYSFIKDVPMKLHYLDGIDGPYDEAHEKELEELLARMNGVDPSLYGSEYQGYEGLGLFKKLRAKIKSALKKIHIKAGFWNKLNRFNPATALLRNGLLLAIKINMLGIGKKIRTGILSREQAQAKKLNMPKWEGVRKIYEKLENIFYKAGGKEKNLIAAIRKGKGNRDGLVGFGELGNLDAEYFNGLDSLDMKAPITELLGSELEGDERQGLEGLGIVGATALAAASAVVKFVVGLLKKNGDPSGDESGGEGGENGSGSGENSPGNVSESAESGGSTDPSEGGELPAVRSGSLAKRKAKTNQQKTEETEDSEVDDNGDPKSGTFMQWVKDNPLKAAGVAAASVGLIYLLVHMFRSRPVQQSQLQPYGPQQAIAGTGRKRAYRKKRKKHQLTKVDL